ncbi:MAG TPA: DoxX family protein [Usitatibacter sp.]|jgi:putative oxidoreductase
MNNTKDSAALVGRVLLAFMFVLSGFGKISGYEGTAGYMASKGLPMIGVLLPLTILTELGGGLALIAGFKARWAALLLAGFSLLAAIIFHDFWTVVDPMQHMNQQINFLKNVSIAGGMLMVFAFGPGRYSVDKS